MKKCIGLLFLCFSLVSSQAALNWHWSSQPSDITASNSIASAMNQAVAMFNTYSDYNYNIAVAYNSGVPTAQSDFHGTIQFGGSISYRVAMHEMSHWLGTGTTSAWATYASGTWGGGYVNSAEEAYDGPAATIGCDTMHYWPYGWNYDNEAVHPEREIGLIGGFVRDQGLDEDRTIGFAPGTYCLRNRGNLELLDNLGSLAEGAPVKQGGDAGSLSQQWTLSLVPGTTYFTLRSLATGKLLDSLGNTADGSPVGQAAETFSARQRWQVLKTDAGFYRIVNVANGKCLDTGGQASDGAGMQFWPSNASGNQQWKFINTTPATIPAGVLSQYRPVTASSFQTGYFPEGANDGKTTVTRWTANGGSYPQSWRVDLGSICNITNAITFWYPGYAFLYRIEISSNDVNYSVAVDATANAIQGTTTNAFSATARYVRITATGINPSGGWAAFFECQIYGTPQIPAAPAGLAATPGSSSQINLSWADQAAVSSYNILRSTTNGGTYAVIATGVKGLSYADAGLADSTTYYYVVSAANRAGESAPSAQATATTPAPVLPAAPTGVTALPGQSQVALNWSASAEAASYYVKRATVNGGPYNSIANPAVTTYTDTTAVNGTTYFYVVSATNAAGESLNSTQVVAAPATMFAHWKFNETNGTIAFDSIASRNGTLAGGAAWAAGKFGSSVSLNGTSSYVSLPTGVVSPLSGNFTIASWVYVNANGTWARLFDFGTGTTAYMFLAPVSGGNTVRYAITTSGGSGEQQINGPILSAGTWHHVAVTLSGTVGTLYVDGLAAGSNPSMTLKPSSLGSTTLNYLGKSQFADPFLNGRVDDFRIYTRALSSAEIIALGNPDGAPAAPLSLFAAAGLNQVALNWTAVPGAGSYKVKRATVNGGPYTTIGSSTTVTYTDTNALNGITYYYVIAAANGTGDSANSMQVAAVPNDLLAYWKFNEASGTTASDSVGTNNGSLATGAGWIAGKINNAMSLNGSSGYASLPAGLVSTLNDFSISTWVYVSANSAWARLFDFGTGTSKYMFLAPAGSGSTVRYAITAGAGAGEQQLNGTTVLSPGLWHHVAVTLSGTTGMLYVDGVAVNTNTSMTLKPSGLGNTTLNYLGKSQFSDPYLNGRVDDFRIYRRALSASEVSTLFSSGGTVPAAPAGLNVNPGDSQVALNWNVAAGATSYKVKRSTTNGGPYVIVTNVLAAASVDTPLVNGTKYFYVVSAANIVGEGLNSAQVSAIPSSTAPVDVAMSVTGGALNLFWPANHIGWRLQAQTNSPVTGLDTNWFDVANADGTNSLILPMDADNAGVFYRLIYP